MKKNLLNEHEIKEYFCDQMANNWEKINKNLIQNKNVLNSAINYHAKLMKKGISYLLGTHNFSAFRASSCSAKSPIRTINLANIKKKKDKLIILFESKSFLQKQVRSMVGCLKYVGEKKWKPEKIKQLINSKKRDQCAPPAPPHGLFLKKVFY